MADQPNLREHGGVGGARIRQWWLRIRTQVVLIQMLRAVDDHAQLPEAVPPAPGGAGSSVVLNPPGHWDCMISYTQRNNVSEAIAYKTRAALLQRGKSVWLDVEMASRDEAAMEEGVKNSLVLIAIVSGPMDGHADDTAYFQRRFCLKELRWATEAGVLIQPIVAA